MISTTVQNKTRSIISFAAAVLVWQLAASILNEPLLLSSPIDVIKRMATIWKEPYFFYSIYVSAKNIFIGFFTALFLAVLLGAISARYRFFETLLMPYITCMKTVPVASFVILALLWFKAERLSIFISFLIVFPVIYKNVVEGIRSVDIKLLEMAKLYNVPLKRKIKMLYLPKLRPYMVSALSSSIGMSWKAGVAAELIARPDFTIGQRLYDSKVYLSTADLFCYTLIIILLGYLSEKIILAITQRLTEGKYI